MKKDVIGPIDEAIQEDQPLGLMLRPSEDFAFIKREYENSIVDRRRFLHLTGAATIGAFMIRPLHVEATESFWRNLAGFFKTFAEGILLSYLGGILPSALGNQNFLDGSGLLPRGGGVFGSTLPTPGDSAKSFILKVVSQVGRNVIYTAFPYVQKWLDKNKIPLRVNLPTPYLNGPGMITLGTPGLAKAYLAKYPQQDNNFKTGLMLPTFQGKLVDPTISNELLVKPPSFDTPKFSQIHEMESGTLVVVTYASQDVVRNNRSVIDRGQGQTTLYVVPSATSNDQDLRERYKNVRAYIRRKSNYWSNEAERNRFISDVVASNSVIQPRTYAYEFQNDI